jgi:tetratricopeptide (TPR) repeat protein
VAATAAGELQRAANRCVTGLALAGDAFADGVHAPALVLCLVRFLDRLLQLHSRQGRLADASDCHARALHLLSPQQPPFWARGITCVSHAGWRDTPLNARDVLCDAPPSVNMCLLLQRELGVSFVRRLHTELGLALARAGGHTHEAQAAYEEALAALAAEPPGPARDCEASILHNNIGNQMLARSELQAARARYDTVASLLAGVDDDGADEQTRERAALLRAQAAKARANLAALTAMQARTPGTFLPETCDADLAEHEATCGRTVATPCGVLRTQWSMRDGAPVSACRTALGRADTPAQVSTCGCCARWSCRPRAPRCARWWGEAAARAERRPPLARRSCRTARARAWRTAAKPASGRTGRAATPAAAAADAVCVACHAPLLRGDDAAPHARQVLMLRCLHLAHMACLLTGDVCPACAPAA